MSLSHCMTRMVDNLEWFGSEGQLLDVLARRLPPTRSWCVTVCGFTPLRFFIESTRVAEEPVSLSRQEFGRFLDNRITGEAGLVESFELKAALCDPLVFASTFDWRARAVEVVRYGHLFRFVHSWDVLVSKLQRLEAKDLDVFRLVIAQTGHPNEREFLKHLQKAVDLYRPKFDEESQRGDMMMNTRLLWRDLWNRDIDPRAEIIRPAVERANRAHSDFDPTLKAKLADVKLPDAIWPVRPVN